MNSFDKLLIIFGIVVVTIFVGFGMVKIQEVFDEEGQTLRLTQNSEFVVENVRADSTGWKYTLENSNLEASPKLHTLHVQTQKPIGYAIGDTLRLLQGR